MTLRVEVKPPADRMRDAGVHCGDFLREDDMQRFRRAVIGVAVAISVVGSPVLAGSAMAQAIEDTVVAREPLSDTVALICIPEPSRIEGTIQTVFHVTEDAAGGLHFSTKSVYQGVSAVGLETGAHYQIVGSAFGQQTFNGRGDFPTTFTYVVPAHVIGAGGKEVGGFDFFFLAHLTLNANGELTADVEQLREQCR
jgi:hypothetical protein